MAVHEFTLPGEIAALADLQREIDQWCSKAAVPASVIADLQLVAEEVVANIIHHGYVESTGDIDVRLELDNAALAIEFVDRATAFNPLAATEPELGQPIEAARIGGLGIPLITRLSHEQNYSRAGGGNRLRLLWRLSDTLP